MRAPGCDKHYSKHFEYSLLCNVLHVHLCVILYYVTSPLLFEYVIIHLQPICALRCIYMMNSMVCLDGFSVIIQMVQGVTW